MLARVRGRLLFALGVFPGLLASAASARSVILISIDTLRADHLGCYGYRKTPTPRLDRLARGGTLFSQVDSPVPMTLPAHTSLLSSTYPFVHGVKENGQQVGSGIVTLATVLQARGFRTGAFIGGYVMDARFGLDRGFDIYDSPFHLRPDPGEDPPEVKRPGEAVLGAAMRWIEAGAGRPFFAFIHLYDAHQPYTHGSYDGEIAYVDKVVGRFEESLASQRHLRNTLIVLTSDHGESLGEHGEETHGYFIYQSTVWVPLIFRWPAGAGPYPPRVDEPSSLVDVAPSLLQWLGVPAPPQFRGHSLMRLISAGRGGGDPVYSESMYARDHFGCSPLRSIRSGRYKLIDSPEPELYDLASDPGEENNRYDREPEQAAELRRRLQSLTQGEKRTAVNAMSAEAMTRLRSLGYLGGAPARPASGADPKERFELYLQYGRAARLANTGHLPDAIRAFQVVVEQDGQNVLAHFYLAVCYYRLQRLDDAMKELQTTRTIARDYVPAEELLATIWLLKQDYGRARDHFVHLAAIAPQNYAAHYNLAVLAQREGRADEAAREWTAAARADPGSAQPHLALAFLYCARGDVSRAKEEFQRAVMIDPHDEESRKALARGCTQSPGK